MGLCRLFYFLHKDFMKHISSVLCGMGEEGSGRAESYDPSANIMRKENFFYYTFVTKLQIMFYL